MSSLGRSAVGALSAYGLSLIVSRAASLVTLPLVTHRLEPDTFGSFATLSTTAILVYFAVVDWGMGTAAMRLATDGDVLHERSLFKTLMTFRLCLAAIAFVGLCAFAESISRLATGSPRFAPEIPLVAASVALGAPSRAASDFLRITGRHRALANLMAALSLIENISLVALVVGLGMGLHGMLWARVGAQIATTVVFVGLTRPIWRGVFDWKLALSLLRFGLPIGALQLLVATRELDRVLIAKLTNLQNAGQYEVAARVAAPLGLANIALGLMIEPIAYRHREKPELLQTLREWVSGYTRVFTWVAFATALLAPEILGFFAPRYLAAAVAVPALLFTDVGEGLRRVAGLGGDLAKKTGLWIYAALANALVTIPLTLVFVPRAGIQAAAVALCIGTVCAATVAYALGKRVHPLRMPVFGSLGAILVGMTIATWAVGGLGSPAIGLGWRIALAIALAGALGLERLARRRA